MGRKTDGERIDDLQNKTVELDKSGSLLEQRLEWVEDALKESQSKASATSERLIELQRAAETQLAALRLEYEKQLADLRRAHEAETKLLKQQVEELKQEHLRWGARLWQVAVGLGVLVIGAALTTYLGIKR